MKTYTFNEGTMFADVADGVAIVINSTTGIYYGFNEFGTDVFEQLRVGASFEGLVEAMKELPGAPADIEEKLAAFVKELEAKEIFTAGEGDGAAVTLNAAAVGNFELSVQEYNDAQEMLLADPIHEVKEDTGWTPETDSIGYTKEETREREKKMEQ